MAGDRIGNHHTRKPEDLLDEVRIEYVVGGSGVQLVRALAGLSVPAGFAWVAGEAAVVGDVRRELLARAQPADRIHFTGYWRVGGPL